MLPKVTKTKQQLSEPFGVHVKEATTLTGRYGLSPTSTRILQNLNIKESQKITPKRLLRVAQAIRQNIRRESIRKRYPRPIKTYTRLLEGRQQRE